MCLSFLVSHYPHPFLCIVTFFWPGCLAHWDLSSSTRIVLYNPPAWKGQVLTPGPQRSIGSDFKRCFQILLILHPSSPIPPLGLEMVLVIDFSWIEDKAMRCCQHPGTWEAGTISLDSVLWYLFLESNYIPESEPLKKSSVSTQGQQSAWGPRDFPTSLDHQAWEWGERTWPQSQPWVRLQPRGSE